ncbi:tubulin folding cofactor, partial [Genlisea aurea]
LQTMSERRDPAEQQSVRRRAPEFRVGQRVHYAGNSRRTGTVGFVGTLQGYLDEWIGVDWDADGDGKHDGSHNGVRYFNARGPKTASFLRPNNVSAGRSLLEALEIRYRSSSTKEEEDEMYVLSSRKQRVSIQLLGKDKIETRLSRFEEMTSASLSHLGISFPGSTTSISSTLPNLKELDLTGNLLVDWEDFFAVCEALPALTVLNLSHNSISREVEKAARLSRIRVLVLNHSGVKWKHIEVLKYSLPDLEELHLTGNLLAEIKPVSSDATRGFNSLRLLDLSNNCISSWDDILNLSFLSSLEQLFLNNNNIKHVKYPDPDLHNSVDIGPPFVNLRSLHLGGNLIEDPKCVDSLNSFPKLTDIRLSDNPVSDLGRGGSPRFVLIARLAKVEILNGSEVMPRERRDSEIRYVRLVMSTVHEREIPRLHPRFCELKTIHGIEDARPSSDTATSGPQKMATGLISVTLKCIGASMGEKAPLTKKLPASTTVGKLKNLCTSFFKLHSINNPILLVLQEEGSALPTVLDDDMASLLDLGIHNESTILLDD